MSDKVAAFPGVTRPDLSADAQPVAEVVETLEALLAHAKSGYLRAIAFSYVRLGARNSYGWSGIKTDLQAMYNLHSGLCTVFTSLGSEIDKASSESAHDEPEDDGGKT